jgi:hypothetical protein
MNEQLKNKLYNYHAQPPIEVWNKIDSALEEDTEKRLSEKIINYQTAPPPFAWQNIVAFLGEMETPVVPFRKRFARPIKYSSAAAILIAILMVANLFINKEPASESDAAPTVKQSTTTFLPQLEIEKKGDQPSKNMVSTGDEQIAYLVSNKRKLNRRVPLQIDLSISTLKERTSQVVDHNYEIVEPEYLDRYIIFSKASGEAFRLSKKMFDLFACPDNDEDCKQNLESIQQRMADPSIMAAGDFTAVLALLQNMNTQ